MPQHQDLVLLAGARTAMTEYVGTPGYGLFKDVSANALGAHAIRAALERAGVPASRVEHVFMGNAMQTSSDAIYGARHAALLIFSNEAESVVAGGLYSAASMLPRKASAICQSLAS